LSRAEKLTCERQSIDLFRRTAQSFADAAEKAAAQSDVGALLVLRHYYVPTRVLDWTLSPWIAGFFAAEANSAADGEVWTFDHDSYAKRGRLQWAKFPETTKFRSGDPDDWDESMPSAFSLSEPSDWFVCLFYGPGFHRQAAQESFYSLTPRFKRDHAQKIAELLEDRKLFHRYVISTDIKSELLSALRENHGIWRGALFPDSAGAAETAKRIAFPQAN
jgi:hypothetical protein